MKTLRDWFQKPSSTLTDVASYNPPSVTRGILGLDPVTPIPPAQALYDLSAYNNAFGALYNRPANVLQG